MEVATDRPRNEADVASDEEGGLVIPCLPGCIFQVLTKDDTSRIRMVIILLSGEGEVSYTMILQKILGGNLVPFRARAFNENGQDVIRLILEYTHWGLVVPHTDTVYEIDNYPAWANKIPWFTAECLKPSSHIHPKKLADAQSQGGNSQTSQESNEQQQRVPVHPPSREGDAIFWRS